jgi:hypothetical protein
MHQIHMVHCVTADMVEVQEVGEGDKAPPEWLGEIEPTFLSYEAVPLLNFPFFNEVVKQHPL